MKLNVRSALAAVAGGVAGWVIWRGFGREWLPKHAVEQKRPLRYTGRTVLVDEIEMFFRDIGDPAKPPIVLIHGAGYDGESTFYKVIPQLTAHYRVVVVDLRSHGKSDRVRGRVTVDALAHDVAGVMDVLDLGPSTVFGYSLGGMVAQVLAAQRPDLVDQLHLGATTALAFGSSRIPMRSGIWFARGFTRISTAEQIAINFRYLRRTGAVEPPHERWLWSAMNARDTSLYWETVRALYRFDGRNAAAGIEAPTCVFVTVRDQVIRPAGQQDLASRIPDATIVEIDAGHEAIMTNPEEFVAALVGNAARDQEFPVVP
ncbi:MAG: alpha/beta fold hydrolase [Acidimicrobiia bacterium]